MPRHRFTWRAGLAALAVTCWTAAIGAAGCKEYGIQGGSSPHREFNFIDMGDQPKIKAQRGDLLGGSSFLPPLGAIPRGFDPYPFPGQPELAGVRLANPLPLGDPKTVERGKLMFERYCVPCHDANGGGEGKVPEKGFPKPPSLMTQKLRDWTDGRIYHVISVGQNIMPTYAAQVRPNDRWAIIRYMRQLQATHPVAPPPANAAPATPTGSAAAPPAPTDSALAPAGSASGAVPPDSSAAPAASSGAAPPSSAAPPAASAAASSTASAVQPPPSAPPPAAVPSAGDDDEDEDEVP